MLVEVYVSSIAHTSQLFTMKAMQFTLHACVQALNCLIINDYNNYQLSMYK